MIALKLCRSARSSAFGSLRSPKSSTARLMGQYSSVLTASAPDSAAGSNSTATTSRKQIVKMLGEFAD